MDREKETRRILSLYGNPSDGALDEITSVGSLRARTASIQVVGETAVVRVRLSRKRPGGRPVHRTVTAGMDAFRQLAAGFGVPGALFSELRAVWGPEADALNAEVSKAAQSVLSDQEAVVEARRKAEKTRAQRTATERTNLVVSMAALLRNGWTREMLVSAVDEASVREVMDA